MIDSNYSSLTNGYDIDLGLSSLTYSCPADSSFYQSNQLALYCYYGDFENQSDLNNIDVSDFTYNEIPHSDVNSINESQYFNCTDDNYDLTLLSNQSAESAPTISAIPTTSSSSTSSLSSSEYHQNYNSRSLSTVNLDSRLDVSRSIEGCKRDLIKATLNYAIKSRRQSLGLSKIELNQVKHQDDPRPHSSSTDEDDEKKMSRRERNRIAARKCRKNRKLKFIGLNKTMESLDSVNTNLREQLNKLKRESEQLEGLLTSHQSNHCYLASQSMLNCSSSPSSLSSSISSLLSTSSSPSPTLMNGNFNYSDESDGLISYIDQFQTEMMHYNNNQLL